MVLDVDRQSPGLRVERGTFGDGPTHQDSVDFEPEVVVQPTSPVPLDHEASSIGARCLADHSAGLGGGFTHGHVFRRPAPRARRPRCSAVGSLTELSHVGGGVLERSFGVLQC